MICLKDQDFHMGSVTGHTFHSARGTRKEDYIEKIELLNGENV